MDFDLTEEQRLLKDSVDRLIADRYDFESAQALHAGAGGLEPRRCGAQYAELGLLGAARSPRSTAASAAAPVETMIVMEAFGRALALEPYLATVDARRRLAAPWRRATRRRAELIPQIAAGELHACLRAYRAAVALRPRRRRDHGASATAPATCSTARRASSLHGDSADKLVVTARTAGGAARPRRHRRCSWSTRTPPACRGAATRRRTGMRAAEVTLAERPRRRRRR